MEVSSSRPRSRSPELFYFKKENLGLLFSLPTSQPAVRAAACMHACLSLGHDTIFLSFLYFFSFYFISLFSFLFSFFFSSGQAAAVRCILMKLMDFFHFLKAAAAAAAWKPTPDLFFIIKKNYGQRKNSPKSRFFLARDSLTFLLYSILE